MRKKKKTDEAERESRYRVIKHIGKRDWEVMVGLACIAFFTCINITDIERYFFWFESYPFASLTCFLFLFFCSMSNDGRMSIHLFDEKSSNHSYNPGRHSTGSALIQFGTPHEIMHQACAVLSPPVNKFYRGGKNTATASG